MTIAAKDTRALIAEAETRLASRIAEGELMTVVDYWQRVVAVLLDMLAAERASGFRRTSPNPRTMPAKPRPDAITLASEAKREAVA